MDNKKVETKYINVPTEAPKMSVNLVVRTVVYLAIIVNSVFAFFGSDLNLTVNENLLYEGLTIVSYIIAFGHAYWRNNDITKKARIKAEAAKQVEDIIKK